MSHEEDKRKSFRVIGKDDDALARPSTDQIHQIYMSSPHLEWGPFCRSMKWTYEESEKLRSALNVNDWVAKKKEILAREQAEQIAELVFDHKSRWHKEVLKTLKDYPEANDAVLAIIKRRINDIVRMINEDERKATGLFKQVQTKELLALAAAMKTVTEAKHKSLLIDNWNVQIADKFSEPMQNLGEDLIHTNWKIEVIGADRLDSQSMQKFLGKYYDKPAMHSAEDLLEDVE